MADQFESRLEVIVVVAAISRRETLPSSRRVAHGCQAAMPASQRVSARVRAPEIPVDFPAGLTDVVTVAETCAPMYCMV